MGKAIKFLTDLSKEVIRDVHSGDVTRKELQQKAVDESYSKEVGRFTHRLIREHANIEAFIAFYIDGISHSMSAAESPEVEGNVADVTVKYPHGTPVKGLDALLEDHDEDPEEWDIESLKVNEWPTTMSGDNPSEVFYVNNYQAKARLSKITREPQYERVQPVELEKPDPPKIDSISKNRPDGWKTALVLMDRQTGHHRGQQDTKIKTIHDRKAIDLAVQVAGLCKPEVLVDVGDLLDFAGISYFDESPGFRHVLQPALCEVAYDNARLMSAAEPEEFHIIEGNHDKRLDKKLMEDAEEMYQIKTAEAQKEGGPPAVSVPSLLNFNEMGITWHEGYPDNEFLLNDGIAIEHGDTSKSDSGGTVRYMLKYNTTDYSRIVGHIHRHEFAWKTVWKGDDRRELFAGSGGALCRVDGGVPGTQDKQNWQQGLIVVHYDPDGWQHIINPIRIWPKCGDKEGQSVCWYSGEKLVSDPPTNEELTEKTGYDFV